MYDDKEVTKECATKRKCRRSLFEGNRVGKRGSVFLCVMRKNALDACSTRHMGSSSAKDECEMHGLTPDHAQNKCEYPLVLRKDDGRDQHVQRVRGVVVDIQEVQSPVNKKNESATNTTLVQKCSWLTRSL